MPHNAGCTRCALHQYAQTRCVWGNGRSHAPILLVGEAPGAAEDAQGRPFVGPAGQVLDRSLQAAGLTRRDVYITNTVKCRPPENRTPTLSESKTCFGYLVEEIATVQPKVIIALGASALKILTGLSGLGRARGALLQPASYLRLDPSVIILATYHPAAVLHAENPSIEQAIISDLQRAKTLLARGQATTSTVRLPDHERVLLSPGYNADQLATALAVFDDLDLLAADCEWTKYEDPEIKNRIAWPWTKNAELFSLSLSGRIDQQTIASVGISLPLPERGLDVLGQFLKTKRLVFHNAMADLIWLSTLPLSWRLGGDTLYLAYLLDETGSHKLEDVAQIHLGLAAWKTDLWPRRPASDAAWLGLLGYNTDDTYATLLLHDALTRAVVQLPADEQAGIRRLYTKLLLPATPMFVRMALRGMALDRTRLDHAIADQEAILHQEIAALGAVIQRRSDEALRIATSPLQVKRLLASTCGIDVETTRDEVMDALADEFPICATIQKIKHQTKLLGTYLYKWRRLLDEQGDGRLHTVYNIVGSVTGRVTGKTELGGNIMLVPRENWIRELFATRPGRLLYSADYSMIEMRFAALIAQEPRMLRLLQRGIDLHTATAAFVNNIPLEQVTKQQRQDAKPVNFGFLYGMGAEKFARYARKNYKVNFTPIQAQAIRNTYFANYAGLQRWYHACDLIFQTGKVKTLFGLVRHYLPDPNKVPNTLVQTPATQLTIAALVAIDRLLRNAPELETEIVAFIHDAGDFEGPDDPVRQTAVRRLIKTVMEHPPIETLGLCDLGIPLEADVKIGSSWGDTH